MPKVTEDKNRIRHRDLARKIQRAAEMNPQIPPLQHGLYVWFVNEYQRRFGVTITPEHVRKWFNGINAPRGDNRMHLAEILNVDPTWLVPDGRALASTAAPPPRPEHEVRGSVNLVAGLIELDGGTVSFVDRNDDPEAEHDISTIIRGAQYNIHVSDTVEAEVADTWEALLKASPGRILVLAPVRTGRFSFDIVEIGDEDMLAGRVSTRKGIAVRFSRKKDGYYAGDRLLRQVETFGQRL